MSLFFNFWSVAVLIFKCKNSIKSLFFVFRLDGLNLIVLVTPQPYETACCLMKLGKITFS